MLRKITLHNFKCFEDLDLGVKGLNVLTGMNGMGKSTVIQSMLLVRQSFEQGALRRSALSLRGEYATLGGCEDVLYDDARDESIVIVLEDGKGSVFAHGEYRAGSETVRLSEPITDDGFALFGGFEYLSAERTAPRTSYETSGSSIWGKNQIGVCGQYTAQYLALRQNDPVESTDTCIADYVEACMNEISPGIGIYAQESESSKTATLNYYYRPESPDEGVGMGKTHTPVNTGFGVTYALPVVVALAKAKKGDILIVENPEAHLHPRGQRRLAEFITETAARGVQIFVETHSDHILNGIRIGVKNGKIPAGDVALSYFYAEGAERLVATPKILGDGRLDSWPDGFFDEWDRALDELIW